MEEYNKGAWEELIERCEDTGVDAFEINFSCPHGMPERKMGMAMGQDCDLLEVGHADNMGLSKQSILHEDWQWEDILLRLMSAMESLEGPKSKA